MEEREPSLFVALEEGARAGLESRRLRVERELSEAAGNARGLLLDLTQAQERLGLLPQPEGEGGDDLEAGLGGKAGNASPRIVHPPRLPFQPLVDQELIEVGGADRPTPSRGGGELLLRQLGDEAQEPRVVRQPHQVLHAVDQLEAPPGAELVAVPVLE